MSRWDLTTEYAWACETARDWETQVPSSSGNGTYTVRWGRLYGRDRQREGCDYGWTCTCKGFEIRGRCSHIMQVAAKDKTPEGRCGWDSFMDDGEPTVDENGEHHCPRCGALAHSYAYAA